MNLSSEFAMVNAEWLCHVSEIRLIVFLFNGSVDMRILESSPAVTDELLRYSTNMWRLDQGAWYVYAGLN